MAEQRKDFPKGRPPPMEDRQMKEFLSRIVIQGETVRLESLGNARSDPAEKFQLMAGDQCLLVFSIPTGSPINPFFVLERLSNFTDHEADGAKDRLSAEAS